MKTTKKTTKKTTANPTQNAAQKTTRPTCATTSERVLEAEAAAPEPLWQDAEDLRWAARHWATRVGVKLARLQLRPMTSKWASISTAGRLTLNTDLLRLPKDLGEFVIVHELVHLLAPNHGPVFKSFLHAYLPDWQQRERELRRYMDGQVKVRDAPAKQRGQRG